MTDFQTRLAALRERFVGQTARQMTDVQTAAEGGSWGQVLDICHVIAGSAGMFGFHGLGDAARELEEAIDRAAADAALQPLVAKLLDEGQAITVQSVR